MPPAPDPFSLVNTRLDGKYDVHSVVAQGGFGVVYRATHRTLQKPVAIKVLFTPPSLPDAARKEFIDNFVFEARTIARLEPPAIVRVLDFGGGLLPSGGAAPWIVLEWIDGQSLEAALAARTSRSGLHPMNTLSLLRPVFDALALAHDEGVAHRDLKPSNVMLARTRQGLQPKLLDFGIAKAMAPDESSPSGVTATRSELRAFTLAYASPEQLGGTRSGPWTDVHALALLMVEVLSGRSPYVGNDTTELCSDVLSPRRPTPAKFGLDVGPWEPIFSRALALRPAERFQHAREFLNALDAVTPSTATWSAEPAWSAAITEPRSDDDATTMVSVPAPSTAITTLRPAQRSTASPRSRRAWVALAVGGTALALAASAVVIRSPATPAAVSPAPVALPPPAPATPAFVPRPIEPASPAPSPAPTLLAPQQPALDAGPPPLVARQPVARTPRAVPRAPVLARPLHRERVPVE